MAVNAAQLYETMVVDRDSDLVAQFLVVSKDWFRNENLLLPRNVDDIAGLLGLKNVIVIKSPALLLHAVASMLHVDDPQGAVQHFQGILNGTAKVDLEDIDPRVLEFAYYLTFERVIPFESSPFDAQAIMTIVAKAKSPDAIGAAIGVGATIGGFSGAWMLLTVPAGIVMVRAAKKVGKLIDQGTPVWKAIWKVFVA